MMGNVIATVVYNAQLSELSLRRVERQPGPCFLALWRAARIGRR